uniref:Putative sister chromatid cohesion protein pds5 log b-a n=1 Tax=Rhipicephalus microplus TaxID=6941 RepID=A0A6M2D5K0_RHIMP
MIFPPHVQPFDSTSDTEFIERQLRACLYQCKQLKWDGNAYGEHSWVKELAQLLSHRGFLSHKSQAVRQLTAHCHTYLMVLTINDVPYSCTSLMQVLRLLVDELALLHDHTSPAHDERRSMFETLGREKLFILMHPKGRKFGAIVHNLVIALYDAVSQSLHLISAVGEFLSPILNNLELPNETLEYVFQHLILPLKEKKPYCYSLSRDLVENASLSLQATIEKLLHGLVCKHIKKNVGHVHLVRTMYLLHEVIFICPMAAPLAFSELAEMIQSQHSSERLAAVQLLSYLASNKSLSMAPRSRYMCQLYLERFNDCVSGIREACLKFSSSFLCCPEFADSVLETLAKTQASSSRSVRHMVIESVTRVALEDSTIITDKLIVLLATNTQYNASSKIRRKAIYSLGKLYRSIALDRLCPPKFISKISNIIMEAYQTANTSDRMAVVRSYSRHLVPLSLSGSYRMELLHKLYCDLDVKALKSFMQLHKNMLTAQLHLRDILEKVLTANTRTPWHSGYRGARLVEELTRDSVECGNLLDALRLQKSSEIASSRDAILKSLEDRGSRVLAEAKELFWTATLAALSEDEFRQLLAFVSEQKSAPYTHKELQLFKILSLVFPLSCGQCDYLSAMPNEQSDMNEEDA